MLAYPKAEYFNNLLPQLLNKCLRKVLKYQVHEKTQVLTGRGEKIGVRIAERWYPHSQTHRNANTITAVRDQLIRKLANTSLKISKNNLIYLKILNFDIRVNIRHPKIDKISRISTTHRRKLNATIYTHAFGWEKTVSSDMLRLERAKNWDG